MTSHPDFAQDQRHLYNEANPYANQPDAFTQDLGLDSRQNSQQPPTVGQSTASMAPKDLLRGDASLESRARMLQTSLNSGDLPTKSNDPLTLDMLGPDSKARSRNDLSDDMVLGEGADDRTY